MEKVVVALVTALAVALAIGIFAAQPAQARATVSITPDHCAMFNAKGDLVVKGILERKIVTESSNGNVIVICKAKFDNTTDKPVKYDAFNNPFPPEFHPVLCGDGLGGFTADWKETISTSGQATQICRFKT